jgi:hypothetical protein
MATIFWNRKGVLMVEFMQKGRWGAYKFCRWISMPDGRYNVEWRDVIN